MSAKRTFFLYFLILIMFCLTSAAADIELQVGRAQDGALSSGKVDSYFLKLNPGDFVETNVVSHGTKLIITIYDPSGKKARGFRFTGSGRKIGFVADDPGGYRLEVALDGKAKGGPYTITLTKIVDFADRLSPPPVAERYESLQIKALRAAVDSGQASAVERFWEDVKIKGAPLIEPLAGDDKNMLVTFLWKGTAARRMSWWYGFPSLFNGQTTTG